MSDLSDTLKPYVKELMVSYDKDNENAIGVIKWYEMHRRCPGDPGAPVVCLEFFNAWLKETKIKE